MVIKGMRYVLALILLIVSIFAPMLMIVNAEQAVGDPIVVAVDLGHGESDKYVDYIMSNITFVDWKIINGTITSDELADVDILLVGQPSTAFSADEIQAINDWLAQGNKAIWVAGDSDYGEGPTRQEVVNNLLEAIGSKLRLELGAIYDDEHNCGAFYRVIGVMDPDDIPDLYTYVLKEGITLPILFHGPTAVIWVDDDGNPHDPLNETFDGLVRIAWSYDTAYYGDNQDPPGMLYEVGVDTNRRFLFVGAEYLSDQNNIIVASGESPYGDYEPGFAWVYHGVALDGPRYVYNMIRWMASVLSGQVIGSPMVITVFDMEDPEGDDNGFGNVTYPTNEVFQEGVFDLIRFTVVDMGETLEFKVYMKNLGDNPWNAPNGFCLQYIHIYALTTDINLPLNTTSFGANVEIADGWNFAILLAPGWGNETVPTGQRAAIYFANGTAIQQDGVFNVTANPDENAIIAIVKKSFLPDAGNARYWHYAVLVLGYDGYGANKIRSITTGDATEWNFGGGDANAIVANVQPLVIDLLAPTAEDQYAMLTSYDTEAGTLAKVQLVPYLAPPETTTTTPTATISPSTSPTTSPPANTTTSPTTTSPTTTSPTTTSPTTTSPTATTKPTTTTPAPAPDYTLYIVIGVVIVIIIVVALFLMKKK